MATPDVNRRSVGLPLRGGRVETWEGISGYVSRGPGGTKTTETEIDARQHPGAIPAAGNVKPSGLLIQRSVNLFHGFRNLQRGFVTPLAGDPRVS